MRLTILAALLCIFACSGAFAEQDDRGSGNFMLPYCKDKAKDPFFYGVCFGTITAISNMTDMLQKEYSFCKPRGATGSQTIPVVILFMEQHPEYMHLPFNWLVVMALHEAFPCPK